MRDRRLAYTLVFQADAPTPWTDEGRTGYLAWVGVVCSYHRLPRRAEAASRAKYRDTAIHAPGYSEYTYLAITG